MNKQINIRIDEIHLELLEKLIESFKKGDVKTNRTDMIQRSIYTFANQILGEAEVKKIVDKHLSGQKLK